MKFNQLFTTVAVTYFSLLIFFPIPLFTFAKYGFSSVYLALISSVILLPSVFFISKTYWSSVVTIFIWCLRILMALIFVATSFWFGIKLSDIVAVAGTLALTFFYEFGYFIMSVGAYKFFLKYLLWLNGTLCVFFLGLSFYVVSKYGIANFVGQIVLFRKFDPAWPNYFGIYTVLISWLAVYFGQENKKYYLWFLITIPTIFFTFSRTAFAALFVSFAFLIFMKFMRGKLSSIVLSGILFILILIGFGAFIIKDNSGIGASVVHNLQMRELRWNVAISSWLGHPLLGYGFRSFTESIPEFSSSDNTTLAMGSSHDDYIDLLIRGGLTYSLAFWLFVLFLCWQGISGRNREPLLEYISCSIVALLLAALFQNPFKDPFILSLFWGYAAAIAYYGKLKLSNGHA